MAISDFFRFKIKALYRDWETCQPQNAQLFMAIGDFLFEIKALHRDLETWWPKKIAIHGDCVFFFAPSFRIDHALFSDEYLITQAGHGFPSP